MSEKRSVEPGYFLSCVGVGGKTMLACLAFSAVTFLLA